MRHAWVLVALVALVAAMMALTAACRHTEIVVVTATPGPPPTPTQTYNQWLGERIAGSRCKDPDHILDYRNENRNPPYSVDFHCQAPTRTPDAVATRVSATITAVSPPTRPPRATLTPTRISAFIPTPTQTRVPVPTPTLAPVSTPTPSWRQITTPQPPPEHVLAELNEVMATDTAVCESSGGINRVEKLRTRPRRKLPRRQLGRIQRGNVVLGAPLRHPKERDSQGRRIRGAGDRDTWKYLVSPTTWESYKEARSAIFWNEDGTWTDYLNCVWDSGAFVVEETSWNWNNRGSRKAITKIEWDCRKGRESYTHPAAYGNTSADANSSMADPDEAARENASDGLDPVQQK